MYSTETVQFLHPYRTTLYIYLWIKFFLEVRHFTGSKKILLQRVILLNISLLNLTYVSAILSYCAIWIIKLLYLQQFIFTQRYIGCIAVIFGTFHYIRFFLINILQQMDPFLEVAIINLLNVLQVQVSPSGKREVGWGVIYNSSLPLPILIPFFTFDFSLIVPFSIYALDSCLRSSQNYFLHW